MIFQQRGTSYESIAFLQGEIQFHEAWEVLPPGIREEFGWSWLLVREFHAVRRRQIRKLPD